MVYRVLKFLLRPALAVFYDLRTAPPRTHLPETGPLVVVANHPNTLLDPLLVGMLWRRELRFLTSSRFFVSVSGWILRAAGAIPLYRQEDYRRPAAQAPAVVAGSDLLTPTQRQTRNDASFLAAYERLATGEALLIFPEGISISTRRLRVLRSGAARIALGAEARHDWRLGVRIVPVGLNYAAPEQFRARLERRVGPPIVVAAYRARYEANPPAAIRALTDDIRRALEAQLLPPEPAAEAALARAVAWVVSPAVRAAAPPAGAAAPGTAPHHAADPAPPPAEWRAALHWLEYRDPARAVALRQRIWACTRHLPLAFGGQVTGGRRLKLLGGLLLGGPWWLWGELQHLVAGGLPVWLSHRLTREVEFRAAVRLGTSMLILPLAYGGQTWLVWRLTHSVPLTVAHLATLPLTGLFIRPYRRQLRAAERLLRPRLPDDRLPPAHEAERRALAAALAQVRADWQRRQPAP